MLALILIVFGILLRFVQHAPNFTPVAAIALFGGLYLNKRYALIVPLVLMILSDLYIGMHNVVLFTWGGFALVALMALRYNKHKSALGVASLSLGSSILFYAVSNFGVWLMGWYPRTLKGLVDCYVMGLPFLRDFTIATFFYAFLFSGIYALVARLVKDTKFSSVLLENR